jgi:hypothetical protein
MCQLTVYKVVESSNEQMLASALSPSPVRVIVHVPDWLPDPESADDDRLPVRVDDVYVVGVGLVQPNARVVAFKQRPRGIKT